MPTQVIHCRGDKQTTTAYVYIGRPSKWGNPYVIGKDGSREEVIAKYRHYIKTRPYLLDAIKVELRNKTLGCWCAPQACHGDVLAEIADR